MRPPCDSDRDNLGPSTSRFRVVAILCAIGRLLFLDLADDRREFGVEFDGVRGRVDLEGEVAWGWSTGDAR